MKFETIPFPKDRLVPSPSWKPPHDIRLISADDHTMEVENLWENKLPAKWKDRAPKHWRDASGWHMEIGGRSLDVPGLNQELTEGCEGLWNRDARIEHMDAEGIDASLLFHGRFQALNSLQDDELYTACAEVYNESLAEYCQPVANRLIGVAVLPSFRSPKTARSQLERIKRLGFKAVQMPSFPRGIRYNSMEMEPLWEALEESGIPLSFHVTAVLEFTGNGSTGANLTRNLAPFRPLLGQLTFAGIFERHPNLQVVFTEGGIGWVAQTLFDMDQVCRTYYSELKPKLTELPSFYWRRQCHATFMNDPPGLANLEFIGVDNALWSVDFPHPEGINGFAGEVAKSVYETVGHDDARKILGGNAAKIWGI
jgi:predicted TIM-barrel fold metal-dependent hydrolase